MIHCIRKLEKPHTTVEPPHKKETNPFIKLLIELLDYPYLQVKLEAVRTLGKIHPALPDSAQLRLIELRNDPQSQAMRETANEALAAILI